ncbi:hexitol phosphatase HxpB [Parasalinivibrio latis]|uniref:hexitol phosphatase HxpB n=1 Tax=Parasalinivibrio latis TaxID=2952610 RepID=UPI0030E4428E
MLKAAIFDMDGLLVDSEPFWQQAQLDVFGALGVTITRQDTINTTGVRIDQIVTLYHNNQGWEGPTKDEVCQQIISRVIELIKENKPMMSGVQEAIEACHSAGLRVALASSSPMTLIQATLDSLALSNVFEVIHSAEQLKYGKPHPEVYLNAADSLGISPQECVALEDSFTGLLAAKSAQMKTIVVPEQSVYGKAGFVIADAKLKSLREVTPALLHTLS